MQPTVRYRLTKGRVEPQAELHKIRQQQSTCLEPRPLLCKPSQQVELSSSGVALDVSRAQHTVGKVVLRGEVRVAQLQTSTECRAR